MFCYKLYEKYIESALFMRIKTPQKNTYFDMRFLLCLIFIKIRLSFLTSTYIVSRPYKKAVYLNGTVFLLNFNKLSIHIDANIS